MEIVSVFTYRLDLAVRLVDTTSGKTLPGRLANVFIDGDLFTPSVKPDECMVFQNIGKDAFHLTIQVKSYEDADLDIDLKKLSDKVPIIDLQMVPGKEALSSGRLFSLEGSLPGIQEIHGIRLGDRFCVIRNFDPKSKKLQIFNPHHRSMERVEYALVNTAEKVFESFKVMKQVTEQICVVDRKLTMKYQNDFPVTPLISGKVFPDGRYCLRVRDEGIDARWLVSWNMTGEDKDHFQLVDFRKEETIFLKGDDE